MNKALTMNNLKTRRGVFFQPFDASHLSMFEMRSHEQELVSHAKLLEMAPFLETIFIDQKVLCIAGHHELWPGVCEAYLIPSIHVPHYRRDFYVETKAYLDRLQKLYRRIQTFSRADNQTDSWMRHLGFVCEGTLVQYTQNKLSYRMWARLRDDD